jgi:hypothetical protein
MARPIKPIQLLLLGCAGIAAFYGAAQWSRSQRALGDTDDDLAAPAAIVASRPFASASGAADAASQPGRNSAPNRADRTSVIPGSTGEPFAMLSWLPAPPPPPPVVAASPPAPVAPVAPPLPFAFVGMTEHGSGKAEAFLAKGDALLIVSAGDTLDNGVYRIESLNPNQIVITHVPTHTQQTINVSGSTK